MELDLQMLASKLSRYREQFQLSVEEVSAATGITTAALVAFENGTQSPSGDDILIIADFYKCDYRFFISNERLASFEQTETLFRKHGDELSRGDRWAVQEFLYLCECEEFLLTQLPGRESIPFFAVNVGTYFKRHGEDAAQALRRHLGYAPNQIGMEFTFSGVL